MWNSSSRPVIGALSDPGRSAKSRNCDSLSGEYTDGSFKSSLTVSQGVGRRLRDPSAMDPNATKEAAAIGPHWPKPKGSEEFGHRESSAHQK
jgi:hypothetical protein